MLDGGAVVAVQKNWSTLMGIERAQGGIVGIVHPYPAEEWDMIDGAKTMGIEHERSGIRQLWARMRWLARYRYFLWMFIYRRIRMHYAGAALGALWSVLTPLLMTVVFSVVWLLVFPSHQIANYPAFLLAGLVPWNYFSGALSAATASIISERDLVQKVPLPREMLPVGVVVSLIPSLLSGLLVYFLLALALGMHITGWVLFIPLIILLEVLFTIGLSFFLATANVFYRDVQEVLQVILQAWFFLTPIWYPLDTLPRQFTLLGLQIDIWRWAQILNPMASLVAAYRDLLYWGRLTDLAFLLRTGVTISIVLVAGYLFFLHYSDRFAEEL